MSNPQSVNILARSSNWGGMQEIHFRVTSVSRQWASRPHLWRPPTDLYETEKSYVVRVEIAGMQNAELNIAIEGKELAIYGHRQPPTEQAAYFQLEVRFGEFLSVLELPGLVNVDKIQAEYGDGFLLVTLPKAGSN
ncbi:MAG: Hsp20/alpha crystallin family protein [Anaerolineales bacterium]